MSPRSMYIASLAEAGACEPLPSSLAGRRKACLLARSVQDSGAPAWLSTRDPYFTAAYRRSQSKLVGLRRVAMEGEA
jgi:hypothetical protein